MVLANPASLYSADKPNQAPLTVEQIEQLQKTLQAYVQDSIEAGGAVSAPAKARVNFVSNPLGANPPGKVGPLPPNSAHKVFTLWDVIAALGPELMANALSNDTYMGIISAMSTRISQLGIQLRSFNLVRKDIQKEINHEQKVARRWGIAEKWLFGSFSILFAFAIAGPAGFAAAFAVVGVNATLQETGAYKKMTQGMSPKDAFAVQLGVSVGIGLLAGGVAGGGMALADAGEASGEAVAQNLATNAGESLDTTALNGAEDTVSTQVGEEGSNVAQGSDSSNPTATVNVGSVASNEGEQTVQSLEEEGEDAVGIAKSAGQDEKAVVDQTKDEGTSGVQQTKYSNKGLRTGWMAFNSWQTIVDGFTSEHKDDKSAKGDKSSENLWGDLILACHGNDKQAMIGSKVIGIGLMLGQFAAGAKIGPGEVLSDGGQWYAPALKRMMNIGAILGAATGTITGGYGAAQGFTMENQYNNMASLVELTTLIDTDAQTAKFIQGMFLSEVQSAARTNQTIMRTVLGVIESAGEVFASALGSRRG